MPIRRRTKEVTAEDFVDLATPIEICISPQATHVVYTLKPGCKKGEHDTSSIWIAEVAKKHSARQLTAGLFEDRMPAWSDAHNIIFVSDRAKAGKSSAIYVISLDGGEAYPITDTEHEQKLSNVQQSPCGMFIAFCSADEKSEEKKKRDEEKDDAIVYGEEWPSARLRLLHIATRKVETATSDGFHVQTYVWRPASQVICYVTSPTPEANSPYQHGVQFHLLHLGNRGTNFVVDFPGPVLTSMIWPSETKLNFLAGYVPDAACTSSVLYQLDLEERSWSHTRYGKYDDASGLCLVRDTEGELHSVMTKVQSGMSDLLIADEPLDKILYSDELAISQVSAACRGEKVVLAIVTSRPGHPPELFSTSGDSDQNSPKHLDDMIQLSDHSSSLSKTIACSGQIFECKSQADGESLTAVFLKPPSVEATKSMPLPTVVIIHGGPYSRSALSFDPCTYKWAPYLVSADYATLSPNYRGGSGFGNKIASAARGGMNTKDFSDVRDIIEAAIKEGLVHRNKIIVGGWSQGGFLSYLSAVSTLKIRGAICGAGITDWDMLTMTSDMPTFEAELAGQAPWATRKGLDDVSARHGSPIWLMQQTAKSDRTPLLLLHGEKDVRVPHTQAVAFHRACMDLDWPCDFVAYPREGHFIAERQHQIDMLNRVIRFCNSHLG